MDAPLQSSSWYRVAALRPRLLAHARLHRHRYRGEVWYLLQDPASNRVHRFTPEARVLIAAMDGDRTVDELWALGQQQLGEHAPTQDEVIQLLGQLHAADLLSTDVSPDALELFERGRRIAAQKRRRSWANPMALRIPLVDPGRFLDRHERWWRRIWSRAGFGVWLAVVLPALALVPAHWPELTHNLADRVLQVDSLLALWLVFPLVKALHELGHATAARAGGGEVHDMGLMLLVLMPVPYVDASSATVFKSRWRRALVAAAGMAVEVFLAALAFYVWLAVEPGLARALMFSVILVAGVSTLLFNGNPLLRYDAYYILADLIEMPNLAQQSTRYWGYLFERYVLRNPQAQSPAATASQRAWFAFYGVASTLYRLFITLVIAIFIAGQFFFIGVLLALWALVMMAVVPLGRALARFSTQSHWRERRLAAALGGAALLGALGMVAAWVPMPHRTHTEGVVWLPDQAGVRAGTGGYLVRYAAPPGSIVRAGQVLAESRDPALDAQLALARARVEELEANHAIAFVEDRARAELVREQLLVEQAALERVLERVAAQRISAVVDGAFVVVQPEDQPGRYHRQGDVLGFVLGAEHPPVVRVVLDQAEVDAVSASTRRVELRLAHEPGRVLEGRIARHVPAGGHELPSRVLTTAGGGQRSVDPRDAQGLRALERVFQIDLEAPELVAQRPLVGQRVYVRFEHEPLPLALQGWRAVRRLFLAHFDV